MKQAALGLLLVFVVTLPLAAEEEPRTAQEKAMTARFPAGQSLRYEFEGLFHFASGHAANVTLNLPEECWYRLHAVLEIEFDPQRTGKQAAGHVRFEGVKVSGWSCADRSSAPMIEALRKAQSERIRFQTDPAEEVRLDRMTRSDLNFEAVHLLLRSAWDLLQTKITDRWLVPSETWVPSRRFLYWPDTFVDGMDVAGASMQYPRDVRLGGRPYRLLKYKQVFSPTDIPAFVEPRSRARDFTGTTVVTGKNTISLLFDAAAQRTVYVSRSRTIDNRMSLKYEQLGADTALATYVIDEQATLRWIPDRDVDAWLAELQSFESAAIPSGATRAKASGEAGGAATLGQVAAATRKDKNKEGARRVTVEEDLAGRPPRGFERWSRSYCYEVYCFDLTLAVPAGTSVAQTSETTTLLVSDSSGQTVTIAVGPVLDRQYPGLEDEELLRKQTTVFISNYLWSTGGEGKELHFEFSSIEDRPAGFSDFTALGRDLRPVHGRLALVISAYNRLLPVACTYRAPQNPIFDNICQTVTASILVR